MRGENSKCGLSFTNINGSPPHAWGKFSIFYLFRVGCRFTPTCVGKIWSGSHCCTSSTVHPHMRGENRASSIISYHFSGSPPHAWGKFFPAMAALNIKRFTPTCVGKICYALTRIRKGTVHPHMRGENVAIRLRACGRSGSPPHAWGK